MEGIDPQRVPVMAAAEARVTVFRDVILGDAEDLTHLDARSYLGTRPVVGLLQHPEKTSGRGLHPPVGERAATIAPVTTDGRSAVELDEVAILQASVALRVDAYPHPRADCGQDPLVRVVLVTRVFHRRPRDAHHVTVAYVRRAHARPEALDHKADPRLGELRSQPELLDLVGVLYAPELVHVVREVHPLSVGSQGRKTPVRIEEHVAEVRPNPGAEQAPVPEQTTYDLILLVLVELS